MRARARPFLQALGLLGLLWPLWIGAACGGGGEAGDPASPGATGPAPAWFTAEDEIALEPTACVDDAGRLWVAWLDWQPTGVRLLVRVDGHDEPLEVAAGDTLARPELAALDGGVYCVWETREQGQQVLRGRELSAADGAIELTDAGGAEGELVARGASGAAIASTPTGTAAVWVASDADGSRHLELGLRVDGAWTHERLTAMDSAGEPWHPRLAADADGELHAVWDAWTGADFDVFAARVQRSPERGGASLTSPVVLAGGPAHQAAPELALDAEGHVWVAWEEAPAFGRGGALRAERSVRLARVDWDAASGRAVARDARLASTRTTGHFPRVAVGEQGVHLTARVLQPQGRRTPGGLETNYSDWRTRQVLLQPHEIDPGASAPVAREWKSWPELAESDGDNEETGTLLVRPADSGLGRAMFVAVADDRSAHFGDLHGFDAPLEGRWRLGRWNLGDAAWPAFEPARALEAVDPGRAARTALPEQRTAAGVLLADLHRHTHLSRCAGAQDGTLDDVWRYARGPGALDVVAVTDHFQHVTPWAWWRTLREVERWNAPGRLVVLPALERVVRGQGHQNLVYREVADARRDHPRDVLPGDGATTLDSERVVAIPHMMGSASNVFTWKNVDPELHRLVEVYQGNRGSYEGYGTPHQAKDFAPDGPDLAEGLGAGVFVGLIGASDHGASASGFALVRATERTRGAVFEALRARAVAAATDPVDFSVELGDLRGGDAGRVAADAAFTVRARARQTEAGGAPIPVAWVDVSRNGQLVHGAGSAELVDLADTGSSGELVVLTTRHRRATEKHPLRLRVRGARLVSVRMRQLPRPGVWARLDASSANGPRALVASGEETVDVALELEALPGESGVSGAVFEVRFREQGQDVELASIALGRSVRLDRMTPQLEYLWHVGPATATPQSVVSWGAPEGLAPGDLLGARVVWRDGAVAWSSPIRVDEVEPR